MPTNKTMKRLGFAMKRLGSSLDTFRALADEWGLDVADLLGPLANADVGSAELKKALKDFSAVSLVENAANAERAKGLDERTIASNAVARATKMLAGWKNMDAGQRRKMIQTLQKHSARAKEP